MSQSPPFAPTCRIFITSRYTYNCVRMLAALLA